MKRFLPAGHLLARAFPIFLLSLLGAGISTGFSSTTGLVFTSAELGNIFADVKGDVLLQIKGSHPVLSGKITLTDEAAKPRGQYEIPPGAHEMRIALPEKGYYRIQAEVQLDGGEFLTNSTTAAVLGPLLDESLRSQSRFGIWTVHGPVELAYKAGAFWNRRMTSLKDISQEELVKKEAAAMVPDTPAAQVGTLQDIGVLAFGLPFWMLDVPKDHDPKAFANPFQSPRDWKDLQRVASGFARQPGWNDFPRVFEIFNEPNTPWKGTEDEMFKALKCIAQTVKSDRPSVKVIGPCFCNLDTAQLQGIGRSGILDVLDGFSAHPYVSGTPPEGEFIKQVVELKKLLAEIGKPDFPIFFTEFGWTTADGTWQPPVDELTQARYVSRSLALLSAQGIDCMLYFCLLFKIDNARGEQEFSVLHSDNTPKPSYAAFANTTRWLTGCEKKGRWLRLSPSTHLVLLRKMEETVLVLWDEKGEFPSYPPANVEKIEDFMGRSVSTQDDLLTVSPSPIYMRSRDPQLFDLEMQPPLRIMRGTSATLPSSMEDAWAPSPLSLKNRELAVPVKTAVGRYHLIGRIGQKWQAQPVDVVSALDIESAQVAWPLKEKAPALEIALHSYSTTPGTAEVWQRLDGAADRFPAPLKIKPEQTVISRLPLDHVPYGQRCRGTIVARRRDASTDDLAQQPFDVTVVPCLRLKSNGALLQQSSIDFSDWGPFDEAGKPTAIPAKDCSASLRVGYDQKGLHLLVQVTDDQHQQSKSAAEMWREDSLQIAFDVDADQPWQPNAGYGFNGHRVSSYGVGGHPQQVMTWRWLYSMPSLPADMPEPRLQAHLERKGNLTTYEITFPWSILGLSAPPRPGTSIGFALAVNDLDGEGPRHGLRLFNGIVETQDPRSFGRLWIR